MQTTMIAERQLLATLLAALRLFQKYQGALKLTPEILRLATDDHAFEMLSRTEIDEFCEELKELAEEMKIADAMFEARNNSGRSEIAATKETNRKVHR
jgi:hypothetical protein